jgi:endonuclease/exonuclease/phosphatase family metal-dependent hydrolase
VKSEARSICYKENMKICFWNIRGLGGKGRRRQLRELIPKHRIDLICLQETMRRKKARLMLDMEELDKKAEKQELLSQEWTYRYKLEKDLEDLLTYEENI